MELGYIALIWLQYSMRVVFWAIFENYYAGPACYFFVKILASLCSYNVTCCEFETKFKFFPSELFVHVLREVFQSLDDDRNLDQHVVHVYADAGLLFTEVHAFESRSAKKKLFRFSSTNLTSNVIGLTTN